MLCTLILQMCSGISRMRDMKGQLNPRPVQWEEEKGEKEKEMLDLCEVAMQILMEISSSRRKMIFL